MAWSAEEKQEATRQVAVLRSALIALETDIAAGRILPAIAAAQEVAHKAIDLQAHVCTASVS